jgi:hypothetical protein
LLGSAWPARLASVFGVVMPGSFLVREACLVEFGRMVVTVGVALLPSSRLLLLALLLERNQLLLLVAVEPLPLA